tara:strand:+ start:225 stop:404 length:180 start_codon:yes stop_codon:yes gene_type:complete
LTDVLPGDVVMWNAKMFLDIGIVLSISSKPDESGHKKICVMWSCGTIMPMKKTLLRKVL